MTDIHSISGGDYVSAALGLLDEDESVQINLFEMDVDYKRERSEAARGRAERRLELPLYPVVYFIQELSPEKFIKIGYATRVADRITALHTGTPYGVRLLGYQPGDRNLEADMHRRFESALFRGEWFKPTQELLDYIATLDK